MFTSATVAKTLTETQQKNRTAIIVMIKKNIKLIQLPQIYADYFKSYFPTA